MHVQHDVHLLRTRAGGRGLQRWIQDVHGRSRGGCEYHYLYLSDGPRGDDQQQTNPTLLFSFYWVQNMVYRKNRSRKRVAVKYNLLRPIHNESKRNRKRNFSFMFVMFSMIFVVLSLIFFGFRFCFHES